MKIAIVGARLAGAYAALQLATQGHEVVMFDESPDREKPCGGGVTPKALRTMNWFRSNPLPHNTIRYLVMRDHDGGSATLPFRQPIHVFARSVLDAKLREGALRAGASLTCERATAFQTDGKEWAVRTPGGIHEFDFLVGADGAASSVRNAVGQRLSPTDISLALGYYVPGEFHPDRVVAAFQEPGFEGYLWSFPRVDHTSVGILRRLDSTKSADLRARVERFIESEYPGSSKEKKFYAARIPCLSRSTLERQRAAGPGWALLGDAAGFADAITAEGIFYALRSAELLAEAFRLGTPQAYEQLWRADIGRELLQAASWRDRFYAGTLCGRAFVPRAVQLTRLSASVRRLSDEVIAGTRSYGSFRRSLALRGPQVLVESILSSVRRSSQAP